MAPIPLEGNQTPLANSVPQEGNRGGSISLAMLIDFIIQRTYHELTVLADLLPRKTDMERKIEIYNYAARTRQLFVRLLGLVKWANSASKVDKSAHIMAFLDKQSLLFVDTADMLARMARETLVHARLPNFHIPAAVEVLTTGTYSRLPACIRERIVPPDPITPNERRTTLLRLNQVIQHRLVTGNLLPQMRNLKIEAGRVTFTVQHEFEVSLTVMGDGPNIPWRLLDIDILVQDKETGDGKALVHSLQVQYIHQVIQSRLVDNPYPLTEVYNCLHYFCQSLQLEVLYSQTLRLCRDRLDDHIHVDEYTPGKCLSISYWRCVMLPLTYCMELTSKDPRSELGYRLTVQVDQHDPAKPLTIVHVPSLGSKESEIADRAIRSELLSMERLLVHTIYVRTRSRLSELKQELQSMLKDVECNLQGSPAILSVPVLQPCLRAEQLLVTVDTHTGVFQCHVPQYDAPLVPELQTALNGDHSRLPMLISELRYWVTQRRCEKTLQHLPATPHERLPLLHHPDHPMSKIGRHRMFVRLHRHPNVILIVEFKEKDNSPCEIECAFYLAVVKHSSIEDNPHDDSIETEIPKMYLKVLTLIEFDSFVITHGPFTGVDEQTEKPAAVKRKNSGKQEPAGRRSKHPAYFIPELAHMVAMCDERLPFVALAQELNRREIAHQGLQVEANATSLMLRLVEMPPPPGKWFPQVSWQHLLKRLLSITIRVHGKASKEWLAEFVFYGSPLASVNPKEQGLRRPVYFQYDMETAENVSKTVDALLCDWAQIVHLYMVVEDLAEYLRLEGSNLPNIVTIKSYSYSRLVLGYGPERAATVTVFWNSEEKAFKLIFGAVGNCVNAHLLMREQLEAHLNRYRDLGQIVSLLHETYEPMLSISKLPTIPQLGVHNLRPQVPVQAFTVMPQCPTLLRLAYQGMYCLELRLRGGGLVTLRDGAYSRFDRSNVVDEFTPTQGLKAFLSKYVDENAVFRRRSQSEDDNPPSPVMMDADGSSSMSFLGSHRPGPQSPAQQREGGLRFQTPLTPPLGSNPHTPASPHPAIAQTSQQHQSFGSSPLTSSFNLASPPSLPPNINPSPSMLPHPSPSSLLANSPSNPLQHVASPAGLMPTSSPGPSIQVGHSPAGPMMSSSVHMDGSPFPSSQSMTSPAASNWPGSPNMPRPSPARPGQSPGGTGHPSMHSPQTDLRTGMSHLSRVLPQRSWAGAVPTLLTHESLDLLCSPSPHPQGLPGPELSPLERFLGCVYMRRQLQRHIQSEESQMGIPNTEPGVVHFKGESLQCRVGLNPQHLQSLHIKVTPLPDPKCEWMPEEMQIIEKFFDTRAAAPPYKPINLSSFCRMLNVQANVLKDFVQIMKLELMPALVQQQQLKWAVQWCLRIPPSATPIAPVGHAAVLICRNKILFFLQITRVGLQYPPNMDPPSLVLPLVYDMSTNLTQLAEKRDPQPSVTTAASVQLKRFAEMGVSHMECSLFPAVRDLLTNLTLPSEPPPQVVSSPAPPNMQPSPAMQMHSPMQPGAVGQPGPVGPPQQPGGPPQPQYSHLGMGQHPMMGPARVDNM